MFEFHYFDFVLVKYQTMFIKRDIRHPLPHSPPCLLSFFRDIAPLSQISNYPYTNIFILHRLQIYIIFKMKVLFKFLDILCLFISIFDMEENMRHIPKSIYCRSNSSNGNYLTDVVTLKILNWNNFSKYYLNYKLIVWLLYYFVKFWV